MHLNFDEIAKNYTADGIFKNLSNFEVREEQIRLAKAIDIVFQNSQHLLANAAAGVGKSFAYLIPAIKYSLQNNKPVIISTNTINLQEQLLYKDIPFLQQNSETVFVASLLKGKNNFVCLRRLSLANQYNKFKGSELEEFIKINKWLEDSNCTGDKNDYYYEPNYNVWEEICCDTAKCGRKKCDFFTDCYYNKSKIKIENSNIVIVNHALFFADLQLRLSTDDKISILPRTDIVIFDEGHNIPDVAAQHLGVRITEIGIKRLLNSIYDTKKESGLLVEIMRDSTISQIDFDNIVVDIENVYGMLENIFAQARNQYQLDGSSKKLENCDFIDSSLCDILDNISNKLKDLETQCVNENLRIELAGTINRLNEYIHNFNLFVDKDTFQDSINKGYIHWIEMTDKSRSIHLVCVPIDTSKIIKQMIFDQYKSVLVISATLSVAGSFDYIRSQFALDKEDPRVKTIDIETPFNFEQQAELYIPEITCPDKDVYEQYLNDVKEQLEKILKKTNGRALVLFTNYKDMCEIYNALASQLNSIGITSYLQGTLSRKTLIAQFTNDVNSVLFAVNAFREGVDIPGESLSCVVIVKLPFEVPNTPLNEAKIQLIKQRNGNPFIEYSLPLAVLDFKQAVGRLIRAKTDTGIIVILDNRIRTKSYGKLFIKSLPKMRIVSQLDEISIFKSVSEAVC